MVRNRSLSAKPSAKLIKDESLRINISKSPDMEGGALHISKRSCIRSFNQCDTIPQTNRSTNFHSLNQTFEIIEESEVFNEEDNGLYDTPEE